MNHKPITFLTHDGKGFRAIRNKWGSYTTSGGVSLFCFNGKGYVHGCDMPLGIDSALYICTGPNEYEEMKEIPQDVIDACRVVHENVDFRVCQCGNIADENIKIFSITECMNCRVIYNYLESVSGLYDTARYEKWIF